MQDIKRSRTQAIKTIGAALAASALPKPFINVRGQEHDFAGKTLRLLTWSDDTGTAAPHNIAATFMAKTGAKTRHLSWCSPLESSSITKFSRHDRRALNEPAYAYKLTAARSTH